MTTPPNLLPHRWGRDEVTTFFDAARTQQFASFDNFPGYVERLTAIDVTFRKAIEALNHSKDWFAGTFLLRSHSNFLGACLLAWSGQVPESYALFRSTLENALYGLYISKTPGSWETWLRRHDTEQSKKQVRNEFQIGKLLTFAKSIDPAEGKVAETLYERAIDHGAHPNERALMQTLELELDQQGSQAHLTMNYLIGNTPALEMALKTSAQVGVCTLSLFQRVLSTRFAILGIDLELDKLRKGL